MISSKKMNRNVVIILTAIFLLLIIPATFADDGIDVNQTQGISDNELEDYSLDESNAEINQENNVIYVNATTGSDDGTGSADNPLSTISKAITLVNDGGTICLNGRFSDERNFNLTFDASPDRITFIGGENTIIDGNHTYSFAVVNAGTYTFNNIIFINNHKTGNESEFGGVFCNVEGDLTFNNCVFENNTLYGVNRANGGAIDSTGKVTINNCIFEHNSVDISNSSGFRKNAADGGAISSTGILYVNNSSFIENKALRNGGAIRTQDRSETYIDNCNFTGNVAAYHLSGGSYGGAIYTWDCGLELANSIFKDNRVYDASGYGGRGGALSLNRGTSTINIKSCQFINNTAGGIKTVDGQSICFDGVEANVNYCTIDTSIYSTSQSLNLNYNWWISSNANIKSLIETLPSSAAVKTYAELKIPLDVKDIEIGNVITITVKLCWNGTDNQKDIDLIPVKAITLTSESGILENPSGTLDNGVFETAMKLDSIADPLITAIVDSTAISFNPTEATPELKISATANEISQGEDAIISIASSENENGICLIDICDGKYYAKLVDGKASISIPNLNAGNHTAYIKYLGNDFDESENTTVNIIVKPSNTTTIDSRINATISVKSTFSLLATDYSAKERGGFITFTLQDGNGNGLANKTVQIALNGKIYKAVTNENGVGTYQISLVAANTYYCALSFQGDDKCNGAPLTSTKLIIKKKSTSIKASAKTFKARAKTKTISVTLKTVKNPYNKKTYLKSGKKLTLKVNGKTYTAKINSKGVAKFKIKLTKKGKYSAKVKFAGDKTYKSSSKSIKIIIK